MEQGAIMYETRDGGLTWNTIPAIQNSTMEGICGIFVVDEKTLVAGGRIGGAAYIAITSDKGLTWKIINPQNYISMITDSYFWDKDNGIVTGGFSTDNSPNEIYGKSIMRIIRTRDGGDTWTIVYSSDRTTEWGWKFSFIDNNIGFTSIQSFRGAGPDFPEYSPEYILKTKDGGENWQEIEISNKKVDYFNMQGIGFITENIGWIGSYRSDVAMRYTYDGGQSWHNTNYVGIVNRFRIINENVLYAIGGDVLKIDRR